MYRGNTVAARWAHASPAGMSTLAATTARGSSRGIPRPRQARAQAGVRDMEGV